MMFITCHEMHSLSCHVQAKKVHKDAREEVQAAFMNIFMLINHMQKHKVVDATNDNASRL